MESKKSIQRKAKANLSEKATPEKAQEESSTPSVRIMKNGIRAVTQAEGLSPKTLQDSVVQELLLDGLPVTRRNYLRYAGLKEPLNPEVEADLPEQLQLRTDRDPGVKVVDIRIMKNGVRAIEVPRQAEGLL